MFREYLDHRENIRSQKETTDDLVDQLKNLALSKAQFEGLANSLRLSDSVKFAKYIPSQEDAAVVFDTVQGTIIAIEQQDKQKTSVQS